MQAALSDAIAFAVQHRIGRGRAVTGDDLKRFARFQAKLQRTQQVQQATVDVVSGSGAVISQNALDFRQRLRNVFPALPVHGFQTFARMQVVKGKRTFRQGGRLQNRRACEQSHGAKL
jgi:hypothetical protein